jgi:hypothetical protein
MSPRQMMIGFGDNAVEATPYRRQQLINYRMKTFNENAVDALSNLLEVSASDLAIMELEIGGTRFLILPLWPVTRMAARSLRRPALRCYCARRQVAYRSSRH